MNECNWKLMNLRASNLCLIMLVNDPIIVTHKHTRKKKEHKGRLMAVVSLKQSTFGDTVLKRMVCVQSQAKFGSVATSGQCYLMHLQKERISDRVWTKIMIVSSSFDWNPLRIENYERTVTCASLSQSGSQNLDSPSLSPSPGKLRTLHWRLMDMLCWQWKWDYWRLQTVLKKQNPVLQESVW